ncbi:MAG: Hsp70 family protein [Oscillospiraceae bacterium]|jgi:molecular chaperone DnaK (HSP70)|nr:Hsp70 family protein [Oscillospiraceae bacterium]
MNVGIDLGTANTAVAYISGEGSLELLDMKGGFLLPSCVYAAQNTVITGEDALRRGGVNPENFVSSAKTRMGRPEKSYVAGALALNPTDVARLVLEAALRRLREVFPEEKEFNAFITVPASFESGQRAETRKALVAAGFKIGDNCVIDEPVAAAIAYGPRLGGGRVLVIDFGGGTLDVSLVEIDRMGSTTDPSRVKVLKSGGDRGLGGDDFDKAIAGAVYRHIRDESPAHTDLSFPSRSQLKYAKKVEALSREAKESLSADGIFAANIYDHDFFEDGSFELDFDITYEEYAALASDLINRVKGAVMSPFGGEYRPDGTDKVLLVGGMAGERFLREFAAETFGGDKVVLPPDRMYLVAKGAAICNSDLPVQVSNKSFTSIGALCVNEKGEDDIFYFIKAGEDVDPGRKVSRLFKTGRDFATAMVVEIAEFVSEEKKTVSRLELSGLTPDFAENQTVRITFSVSEDKYISVSAEEVSTGREISCNIRL